MSRVTQSSKNIVLSVIVMMLMFVLSGCVEPPKPAAKSAQQTEQMTLEQSQAALVAGQPAPIMTYSLERENIKKRLERFNDPNKVGYLYTLTDNGQIVNFYVVKGKISSVNSYMTTAEQIICQGGRFGTSDSGGSDYQCLTMEAPDSDGSYGTNGEAIFWFDVNDVYGEWNGKYQYLDQPLQLSSPPLLVSTEVITK